MFGLADPTVSAVVVPKVVAVAFVAPPIVGRGGMPCIADDELSSVSLGAAGTALPLLDNVCGTAAVEVLLRGLVVSPIALDAFGTPDVTAGVGFLVGSTGSPTPTRLACASPVALLVAP